MPTINKLSLDGVIYDFGGGIDTSDATALASDILFGKTAYARGFKLEGTIQLLEETVYTPKNTDQTIEFGKYLKGNQIIKGDPNLIAENILLNKEIFGIVGKLDVLAFGCPQNGLGNLYWNGSTYTYGATNGSGSLTFAGTPLIGYAMNGHPSNGSANYTSLNVCGNTISTGSMQLITPKSNSISWGVAVGKNFGNWVILGYK